MVKLYFDTNNKIDTFYYLLKLRCITKTEGQFISPNEDGINDYWEIPQLIKYPNNTVKLFNRWGNLVYEKKGYVDEFCGVANVKIKSESGDVLSSTLPDATYYYIIDLGERKLEPYTGYLYIRR
mgnify:CR=1 FL=1